MDKSTHRSTYTPIGAHTGASTGQKHNVFGQIMWSRGINRQWNKGTEH